MFTGIVERTAVIESIEDRPGGRRLRILVPDRVPAGIPAPAWGKTLLGESISVNGACLTVASIEARGAEAALGFEVVPETLEKTSLGALHEAEEVNIERSLAVGDRFGGHYVTGHVDGLGSVRSRRQEGDQVLFRIDAPRALIRQILPKGSIAVDGISLTVIHVERSESWFSFAAIPHTMDRTTLGRRQAGATVNLETDAFGKWVLHALGEGARSPGGSEPFEALLERCGFKSP